MKLIKLNEEHYVIVDDSEIKEGDWVYCTERKLFGKVEEIQLAKYIRDTSMLYFEIDDKEIWCKLSNCKKITHSTQPLGIGWQQEVIELSLQEVKELIGEVNVEKKAESYKNKKGSIPTTKLEDEIFKLGYKDGYNQALEDNKERRYTEDDLRKAYMYGDNYHKHTVGKAQKYTFESLIQYLQPKTEWEVEFVDVKLKLL